MRLEKKRLGQMLLFSLLSAFVFLLICSKSSPLYPMNDWVDVNCFFTLGKGMRSGLVPYRDLYEQKGPLLYMLYALASAISDRSFLGAFLLDGIAFALFLFFSLRILQLFLGERRLVYPLTLALGFMTATSPAFAHGGSVECLAMWMLSCCLWIILRARTEDRKPTAGECFAVGAMCSAALYLKFTFCGFFLGLVLYMLIWYLRDRAYGPLLRAALIFLAGMLPLTLVVFAYFAWHGAVLDFLTVYFYNNIFLYGGDTGSRIGHILVRIKALLRNNLPLAACAGVGGLWLLLRQRRTFWPLLLSFGCLILCVYFGGRYFYYDLIIAPAAVLGIAAAGKLLDRLHLPQISARHSAPLTGLALVLLAGASLLLSGNTYLLGYEKDELPQYIFAEQINQVEDATLLNYGFLDGGFYFAADVQPTYRHFCKGNIELPGVVEEQQAAVREGGVDFVVTQNLQLERIFQEPIPYKLVADAAMPYEAWTHHYFLYRNTALDG